ncbi:hypothetical protein PSPO01_00622 [Paraphaeosphaeria sporulosa]
MGGLSSHQTPRKSKRTREESPTKSEADAASPSATPSRGKSGDSKKNEIVDRGTGILMELAKEVTVEDAQKFLKQYGVKTRLHGHACIFKLDGKVVSYEECWVFKLTGYYGRVWPALTDIEREDFYEIVNFIGHLKVFLSAHKDKISAQHSKYKKQFQSTTRAAASTEVVGLLERVTVATKRSFNPITPRSAKDEALLRDARSALEFSRSNHPKVALVKQRLAAALDVAPVSKVVEVVEDVEMQGGGATIAGPSDSAA